MNQEHPFLGPYSTSEAICNLVSRAETLLLSARDLGTQSVKRELAVIDAQLNEKCALAGPLHNIADFAMWAAVSALLVCVHNTRSCFLFCKYQCVF